MKSAFLSACKRKHLTFAAGFSLFVISYLPLGFTSDWPMAAQNPGRTGYVSDEVRPVAFKWRKFFDEMICTYTQPVVRDGALYIGTVNGRMRCLDAESGKERWVFNANSPILNTAAIEGGIVVFAVAHGKVHGLDVKTGDEQWVFDAAAGSLFPLDHCFNAAPLTVRGKVFIGSHDGHCYAIDSASGDLLWKTDCGSPLVLSAAYADGKVYLAGEDMRARCLDAGTGETIWMSEPMNLGLMEYYWPVIVGDYVVFRGWTGVSPTYIARIAESYRDANELEKKEVFEKWRTMTAEEATADVIARLPELQSLHIFNRITGERMRSPPVLCGGVAVSSTPPPAAMDGEGKCWVMQPSLSMIIEDMDKGESVSIPSAFAYRFDPATGAGNFRFDVGHHGAVDETSILSVSGNLLYRNHEVLAKTKYVNIANPSDVRDVGMWHIIKPWEESVVMNRFSNQVNGAGRSQVVIAGNLMFYVEYSHVICIQGVSSNVSQ